MMLGRVPKINQNVVVAPLLLKINLEKEKTNHRIYR